MNRLSATVSVNCTRRAPKRRIYIIGRKCERLTLVNRKLRSSFDCILISPHEYEVPAILLVLFNRLENILLFVFRARILFSVSHDENSDSLLIIGPALRSVLVSQINRVTDPVYQLCSPSSLVLFLVKLRCILNLDVFVQNLNLVAECNQ